MVGLAFDKYASNGFCNLTCKFDLIGSIISLTERALDSDIISIEWCKGCSINDRLEFYDDGMWVLNVYALCFV